jgi:hypothetical protein
VLDPERVVELVGELNKGGESAAYRTERLTQNFCGVRELWSSAHACMSDPANMTPTQDELRLAIQVLGGPKAASRMLGGSDTLVRHWLADRRLISAEKARRLRELIISVNSALPGIAYNLKVAVQHAEERLSRWRALRPGGNRQEATSRSCRRSNEASAGGGTGRLRAELRPGSR